MNTAPKPPASNTDRLCSTLTGPLSSILLELRAVLSNLNDERFVARMGPLFQNSTIGGHVRHCLDHARSLVDGVATGVIDYDHRVRGTPVETSVSTADAEIVRLLQRLGAISASGSDEPIDVAVMPSRDGASVNLGSTIGRELAFVLSHTIHHNATIRGMAISQGVSVPDSLGYAPSTLAHQDTLACAR